MKPILTLLSALTLACPLVASAAQFYLAVPFVAKQPRPPNIQVGITSGQLTFNLYQNQSYDLRPHLTVKNDPNLNPDLTIFTVNGALPEGIALQSPTLEGIATGSPTSGSFEVLANYRGLVVGDTFSYRVLPSLVALSRAEGSTPVKGEVGKPYSHNLSAHLRASNVPDGAPGLETAKWSSTSPFPAGLALRPDGVVSGTPTQKTAGAGSLLRVKVEYLDKSQTWSYVLTVGGKSLEASKLVAGYRHSCAITMQGGLVCWGDNEWSQLGGPVPQGGGIVAVTGMASGVTDVSIGNTHTCAVQSGQVKCWGTNFTQELGVTIDGPTATPVAVPGISGTVKQVALGQQHSCALNTQGQVFCWGDGGAGQLGEDVFGRSQARLIPGLPGAASAIAAGGSNSCAVVNANVYCWGSNSAGQAGAVPEGYTVIRTPHLVPNTAQATSVAVGSEFACAVVGGAVKCWGSNDVGQLGTPGHASTNVPTTIAALTGGATEVAASMQHACAVHLGVPKCWGYGGYAGYSLGRDPSSPSDAVQAVRGFSSATSSLGLGQDHGCVIESGLVKCWGWNSWGALNGHEADYSVNAVTLTE